MEHVVFFPGSDGSPAFRRVGSLDEAVAWVERLHNVDDLTDFSVHALTEVPLSVRAYYKVEVPASPEFADDVDSADVAREEDAADLAETFAAPFAEAVPPQAGPDLDEELVRVDSAPRAGLGFFTN